MAQLAWLVSKQVILLFVVAITACGFGLALLSALHLSFERIFERYLFALPLGYGSLSMILLVLGALALYYAICAWLVMLIGIVLFGYFGRSLLRVRWRRPAVAWSMATV